MKFVSKNLIVMICICVLALASLLLQYLFIQTDVDVCTISYLESSYTCCESSQRRLAKILNALETSEVAELKRGEPLVSMYDSLMIHFYRYRDNDDGRWTPVGEYLRINAKGDIKYGEKYYHLSNGEELFQYLDEIYQEYVQEVIRYNEELLKN